MNGKQIAKNLQAIGHDLSRNCPKGVRRNQRNTGPRQRTFLLTFHTDTCRPNCSVHQPSPYVSLLTTAIQLLINPSWCDILILPETEIRKIVNCYKLEDNFSKPLGKFLGHYVKAVALAKTALHWCKDKGTEARILLSPHFYRPISTNTELNSMDRLAVYLHRVLALPRQRNSLYFLPVVEVFGSHSFYKIKPSLATRALGWCMYIRGGWKENIWKYLYRCFEVQNDGPLSILFLHTCLAVISIRHKMK